MRLRRYPGGVKIKRDVKSGRDENNKGLQRERERGSAVNAGIIQLGETIGLRLTTVWRGQPHTAP